MKIPRSETNKIGFSQAFVKSGYSSVLEDSQKIVKKLDAWPSETI